MNSASGKRAFSSIILAAGEGKRMFSKTPKVLHTILGKPVILFVAELARKLGTTETIVVVGKNAQMIKQAIGMKNILYAEQHIPLGTGDAAAKGILKASADDVLILCGDVPLLKNSTIEKLIECYRESDVELALLTCFVEKPDGYGRILRDKKGCVIGIVEQKDASKQQQRIKEINVGVYIGRRSSIREALKKITMDNVQRELYLTDVVKYFLKTGKKVVGLSITNEEEMMGINTKLHLAKAREVVKRRWFEELMDRGVLIEDPATTSIDLSVKIGEEVSIRPFTMIEGETLIKDGASVGPFAWIRNGRRIALNRAKTTGHEK